MCSKWIVHCNCKCQAIHPCKKPVLYHKSADGLRLRNLYGKEVSPLHCDDAKMDNVEQMSLFSLTSARILVPLSLHRFLSTTEELRLLKKPPLAAHQTRHSASVAQWRPLLLRRKTAAHTESVTSVLNGQFPEFRANRRSGRKQKWTEKSPGRSWHLKDTPVKC